MKKYLILGTRKAIKITHNDKSADFFINTESKPKAVNLLDKAKMRPKGPGKYTYRNEYRNAAEEVIRG